MHSFKNVNNNDNHELKNEDKSALDKKDIVI